MPVQTPHAEYKEMAPKWEKCRDTHDGSDAIKNKGQKYLPQLDIHAEIPQKYQGYLSRAYFYAVVGRTVEGLSGAIFQKSPAVEFPDKFEDMLDDVTLTGTPFDSLALGTTQEVLTVGRAGILVDMATEEATEQRPYAVLYNAEDIMSWRSERRGGDEVLTRVVLREGVEEVDPKDPFVLKQSHQYRVCELTEDGIYTQTIWKKEKETSDKYVQGETFEIQRRGQSFDFIPFVFFSPTSLSPDVELPPLDALVDTNLSHYRNSADYEHGLHYTGTPIPYFAGMRKGDDGRIKFGSNYAVMLDKDGKAGIIQADGNLLGALENSMARKEKMMATLGARLLEEQSATQETATAVGMRHAGEHATLRTIAQNVGQGLTQVLQWMAWWMGTETSPADVEANCDLNKDFFIMRLDAQKLQALVMALQADSISFDTFYASLESGEITARAGIEAEEELAAIGRTGGGEPLVVEED